jgi:hypothetical protein
MASRARNHIRSNVVGYIAIFLFAMSGTAMALDGSNTVFSDDIVNGEVRTADIRDGDVGTLDLADAQVRNVDLQDNSVDAAKIATNGVGAAEIATDAVNTDEILDNNVRTNDVRNGTLGVDDLGTGSVASDEIADETVTGADLAGTGEGTNGFNGDQEIIDGTITGFDIGNDQIGGNHIVDGSLTAGDTSNVFDAGYGSDTACADDDQDGEVCAFTTFDLHQPGVLLVNATGEWVNASGPGDGVRMVCVLQVDGSDIGLAQSIGEAGANHPSPDNGTMALTALSPQLNAGTHTAQTLCAELNADIDLNTNQITAVRVDL